MNTQKGWTVRRDPKSRNDYYVFFNGLKVAHLCDSSFRRGSLPHIIVIPSETVDGLTVSVHNDSELRQNSMIEDGYTNFHTPRPQAEIDALWDD